MAIDNISYNLSCKLCAPYKRKTNSLIFLACKQENLKGMFHIFQNTCPDLTKSKATHALDFNTFHMETFFKMEQSVQEWTK